MIIILMNQQRNLQYNRNVLLHVEHRDRVIRNVVTLTEIVIDLFFLGTILKSTKRNCPLNNQNQFIILTTFYFLKMIHPEIIVCDFWDFCFGMFVKISFPTIANTEIDANVGIRQKQWIIWFICRFKCHPFRL